MTQEFIFDDPDLTDTERAVYFTELVVKGFKNVPERRQEFIMDHIVLTASRRMIAEAHNRCESVIAQQENKGLYQAREIIKGML
jgi:hypothetical protein